MNHSRRDFLTYSAAALTAAVFPNSAYSQTGSDYVLTSPFDSKELYVGSSSEDSYKSIGVVDMKNIVMNTPSYKKIEEDKITIEKKPGEYWSYMNKASEEAIAYIEKYAEKFGYEAITTKSEAKKISLTEGRGSGNSLDKLLDEIDLTKEIIEFMKSK